MVKEIELTPELEAMWLNYTKELSKYNAVLAARSDEERLKTLRSIHADPRGSTLGIYNGSDQLIGFCMFAPEQDDSAAEIAEFYIRPEYRKTGYGTLAVLEIIKDVQLLYLEVLPENTGAKNFWKLLRSEFELVSKSRRTDDGIITTAYYYRKKAEEKQNHSGSKPRS